MKKNKSTSSVTGQVYEIPMNNDDDKLNHYISLNENKQIVIEQMLHKLCEYSEQSL